jgi:hypothetical protein
LTGQCSAAAQPVIAVRGVTDLRPMIKDRFISYSHKDRKWLELFLEHLNPLAERKLLSIWSDTDILVGLRHELLDREIFHPLTEAHP